MLLLGLLFMAFLVLVVQVITGLRSYDYIGEAPTTPNTITLTGEGKVTGVPNIATIDLGMLTAKKTVAEAQANNVEKMNALTNRLKSLGIESKDLTTTQYNISPHYDYLNGRSEISGYDVQQTLNVKVRDLAQLNSVLQAAAEVGSNQIGGLIFTVDNVESLKAGARLKAIRNAQDKAQALAEAVGVKLGRIVSFNESSDDIVGRPPVPYAFAKEGLGGAGGAPEVQQGSLDIVSNVTLSYELR